MQRPVATAGSAAPIADRIERHAAIDRLFHWVMALSVLTLLATGLLPVVGIKFPWVTAHWVAGVVLVAAVIFHIVRSLLWQRIRCVLITGRDLRAKLPGKYSIAQKLMHHAMTLVVLTAVVTGVPMMAKVSTPFWERNPYLLSAGKWGVIYVLHGLAALVAITLVMIHVYFGLLPENRMYLRAMIRGWITRSELLTRHDPDRWSGKKSSRR